MNRNDELSLLLKYERPYVWRGGALELIHSIDPEVVLAGPSETGKSYAACYKAHMACREWPGAQGALVRKVAATIPGTILATMKRIIGDFPVNYFGGDHNPERIIYPNGATIWIGGMDKPGKVLSGERDFIQICQAEELALNDWEIMTTRTTGRGAVMPYTQIFGDCNPGGNKHFLRTRPRVKLIASNHVDNPTLYDDAGTLTEQGRRTMETLGELTGIRRKRLLEGIWATAEGVVYDGFDTSVHVCVKDLGNFDYWALAIDEGYTNPAVVLLIGIDNDGRLHIAREFYKRGVVRAVVVKNAIELYQANSGRTDVAVVDAAAAGLIADLRNAGLNAQGAKGRVTDGIGLVQNMLRVQGDGLPRLTVDPSCVNVINEFESYIWKQGRDEPVKENDHALDALRYLATWLTGEYEEYEIIYDPVRI